MNNIEEVCEKLLDNANLQVNLSNFPDILLNFVMAGKVNSFYWKVVFELLSVTKLSISKEHEEEYASSVEYLVLSASVKELEAESVRSYIVNIGHDSDLIFRLTALNLNGPQFRTLKKILGKKIAICSQRAKCLTSTVVKNQCLQRNLSGFPPLIITHH